LPRRDDSARAPEKSQADHDLDRIAWNLPGKPAADSTPPPIPRTPSSTATAREREKEMGTSVLAKGSRGWRAKLRALLGLDRRTPAPEKSPRLVAFG
jgi:hypothetical protein